MGHEEEASWKDKSGRKCVNGGSHPKGATIAETLLSPSLGRSQSQLSLFLAHLL